jgi:hypothetical protein
MTSVSIRKPKRRTKLLCCLISLEVSQVSIRIVADNKRSSDAVFSLCYQFLYSRSYKSVLHIIRYLLYKWNKWFTKQLMKTQDVVGI